MGLPERAVLLFGAQESLRGTSMQALPREDSIRHRHSLEQARGDLGAEAFTQFWDQGRAMTLEQALAYALETGPRPRQGPKSSRGNQTLSHLSHVEVGER